MRNKNSSTHVTICSVTNLSSPGRSVTSFGYFLVCAFPPSGCVNLVFALWSLIDYRIRLFFHVPTRACVRIFGAPPHNCPCRCLLLRTRFEGKAYQARRHASCVPAGAHLNRVSEAQAGFCESLSHLSSHMSGTCWGRSHLEWIATVGCASVAARCPRPINMHSSRFVGSICRF